MTSSVRLLAVKLPATASSSSSAMISNGKKNNEISADKSLALSKNRSHNLIPEAIAQTTQPKFNDQVDATNNYTASFSANIILNSQDKHKAPLASLDCSITEQLTDSHTTNTITPTLSGYFDCDELSDMIDDSLFEITNAGCLSNSVFGQRKGSRIRSDSEALEGPTSEELERQGTPTNERLKEEIDSSLNELSGSSSRRNSQAAILANYTPLDYSSTSTIPTHLMKSNKRIKTVKTNKSSTSLNRKEKQKHTRSNPDMRNNDDESCCNICRNSSQGTAIEANKKKKRFTFSLFNLFTGGNHHSNQATDTNELACGDNDKIKTCVHHQQQMRMKHSGLSEQSKVSVSRPLTNGSADTRRQASKRTQRNVTSHKSKLNSSNGDLTATVLPNKARDSIKITNQRKQRNINNGNARATHSLYHETKTDPQAGLLSKTTSNSELLLDFPASGAIEITGESCSIRPSKSNYSLRKSLECGINSALASEPGGKRQPKSVKFTMPDKVMIMSNTCKGADLSQPNQAQKPMAPIIKRCIPKSSSYSQTELDKSLDELLAKYESNNELIVEINEKLKLTETIASPMSTLDRCVSDKIGYDDNYETTNELVESYTNDNNYVNKLEPQLGTFQPDTAETLSSTSSNKEDNYLTEGNHQAPDIGEDYSSEPDNDSVVLKKSCISTLSSRLSAESNEAEEAGFSRDWLKKRQTFV